MSNNFFLKWVNGTTVSKCYGCNGRIPNPPTTPLENLIIARKDVTHYHHRTTDQLQWSSQPQNLHFHLNLRCVIAKHPMFLKSDLKIDQDMYAYLTPEHKMKLFSGFNVVAWQICQDIVLFYCFSCVLSDINVFRFFSLRKDLTYRLFNLI